MSAMYPESADDNYDEREEDCLGPQSHADDERDNCDWDRDDKRPGDDDGENDNGDEDDPNAESDEEDWDEDVDL